MLDLFCVFGLELIVFDFVMLLLRLGTLKTSLRRVSSFPAMDHMSRKHEEGEGDSPPANAKLQKENGSSKSTDDPNSEEESGVESGVSNATSSTGQSQEETNKEIQNEESKEGAADASSTNGGETLFDGGDPTKTEETAKTYGKSQSGDGDLLKKGGATTASGSGSQADGVRSKQTNERSISGGNNSSDDSDNTTVKEKRGNDSGVRTENTTATEERGKGSEVFKTTISTEQSQEETKNERENKSNGGDILKQNEAPKDESGKGTEVSKTTISTEQSQEETKNERDSQFNGGDILKQNEGTMETAPTDERESHAGGIKSTHTEGRNVSGDHCPAEPGPTRTDSVQITKKVQEVNNEVNSVLITQLRKQLQDLCNVEKENKDLRARHESYTTELEKIITENQKLLQKDFTSQEKLCSFTSEVESHKSRVSEMEFKLSEMEHVILALDEKLKKEQTERDELKISHTRLNKEIETTKKRNSDLESLLRKKKNVIEEQEGKLKKEQSSKKNEIEKLQTQFMTDMENAKSREYKLKQQKDDITKQKESEIKVLKTQASENMRCINLHQQKIRDLNAQKAKDDHQHKEEVNQLKAAVSDESKNLYDLSFQYNHVVQQKQSISANLQQVIQEKHDMEHEKQELLLRLSKLAGANLTYNNPNIADLSDEKRPTKLAEEFSELYDNEWTDAFEVMPIDDEKEKTTAMLEMLIHANRLCIELSTDHKKKIQQGFCTLTFHQTLSTAEVQVEKTGSCNHHHATTATSEERKVNTMILETSQEKRDTEEENEEHLASANVHLTEKESSELALQRKEANDVQYHKESDLNVGSKGNGGICNGSESSVGIERSLLSDSERFINVSKNNGKEMECSGVCTDKDFDARKDKSVDAKNEKEPATSNEGARFREAVHFQSEGELDVGDKGNTSIDHVTEINVGNELINICKNDDEKKEISGNGNNGDLDFDKDADNNKGEGTGSHEGATLDFSNALEHEKVSHGDAIADTNDEYGEVADGGHEGVDEKGLVPRKAVDVNINSEDENMEGKKDIYNKREFRSGSSGKVDPEKKSSICYERVLVSGDDGSSNIGKGGESVRLKGENNEDKDSEKRDEDVVDSPNTENLNVRSKGNAGVCPEESNYMHDGGKTYDLNVGNGEATHLTEEEEDENDYKKKNSRINNEDDRQNRDICNEYTANLDETEVVDSSDRTVDSTGGGTKIIKRKIRADFEQELKNEQKKAIMDIAKIFELKLSGDVEKVGTEIILNEQNIMPGMESVVLTYIQRCMNVCWSMCRHVPPVHIDFPDVTGDIPFDTNKYKPYTKTGKYIHFIVWPAIFLHEGGPMLSKGVAQGRN